MQQKYSCNIQSMCSNLLKVAEISLGDTTSPWYYPKPVANEDTSGSLQRKNIMKNKIKYKTQPWLVTRIRTVDSLSGIVSVLWLGQYYMNYVLLDLEAKRTGSGFLPSRSVESVLTILLMGPQVSCRFVGSVILRSMDRRDSYKSKSNWRLTKNSSRSISLLSQSWSTQNIL